MIASVVSHSLLAADSVSGSLRNWDWDFPQTPFGIVTVTVLVILYLVYVVWLYLKDTQMMNVFWRGWLLVLRISVLAGLLIIAFNPQLKTQQLVYHPSKVGLLFDTSLSMRFPSEDAPPGAATSQAKSRFETAREIVFESDLVNELQKNHEVSIFTFDSQLSGPHHIYASQDKLALRDDRFQSGGDAEESDKNTNWELDADPTGAETRLADNLNAMLSKMGQHLSGIVVLTDGASNAGLHHSSANNLARSQSVRLIAVGLGGTKKPVNLTIASVQAPSLVRISDQPDEPNDSFDVAALVQGEGLNGQTVDVQLLMKPKDDPDAEPTLLESREVTFEADFDRVELKFEREPTLEGREEYIVKAVPRAAIGELNQEDNEKRRTVSVTKKKLEILIVAGGPMRDYRFLRSMLNRRAGVEMDIWLQTVDSKIAGAVDQDSRELLTQFPSDPEQLSKYDVIIAFDPDWTMLEADQVKLLTEWVGTHAGGMIYVAGDVFTGEMSTLADSGESLEEKPYKPLLDMLPVYLTLGGFDIVSTVSSETGWPVEFTKDGEDAGFLQLEDDPGASRLAWKDFPGIYRCFPTLGSKPTATVYATFSDPRFASQYGQPILIASQFYGAGRVLYLGSGEIWRIRSISDEYFDRFWIRAIREVSQGRTKQGNQRITLMPERQDYYLGQTVRVRARAFDRQLAPLTIPEIELHIFEPDGKEIIPVPKLVKDPNREGEYVGDFRVTKQGNYRLELPDPARDESIESQQAELAEINVTVPRLESDNTQQNPKLLRELVADTNGEYLTVANAVDRIPELLPNRGEELQIDVSSRPLWDRDWVMYLLIGLLSLEWLTRKLLKLA